MDTSTFNILEEEVKSLRDDIGCINTRMGIIETKLDTDNDVLVERVDKLEIATKDLDGKMLEVLVVSEVFKTNVKSMEKTQEKFEVTQLELSNQIGNIKNTIAYWTGGVGAAMFLANILIDKLL